MSLTTWTVSNVSSVTESHDLDAGAVAAAAAAATAVTNNLTCANIGGE